VPPPSRSNGIGASDNGLAAKHDTTRERIRRPGPWTSVPNYVLTERRLRPCSTIARHLYVLGWIYANQARTDGEIRATDLRSVAASMDVGEATVQGAAEELVHAGLWEPGYRVIDFSLWNLSAEEITRRAKQTRHRVQRHRDKKVPPDPFKEKTASEDNRSQQKATGTERVTTALDNALHTPVDGVEATQTDELVTAWCQQTGRPASSRDLAELRSWEEEFGFRVPVGDIVTTLSEVWARAVASGVTPEHPQYFRRAIRELCERTPHSRSANGVTTPTKPYVEAVGIGEPPPWPKS
jgi:hypothetical protein